MESTPLITVAPASTNVELHQQPTTPHRPWLRTVAAVVGTVAVATVVMAYSGGGVASLGFTSLKSRFGVGGEQSSEAMSVAEMDSVTLSASNEYTSARGNPGKEYSWFDEGTLVEPHRQTTLSAVMPATVTPSTVKMHWHANELTSGVGKLEGTLNDDGITWQTNSKFTVPGQYTVEIEVTNAEGAMSTLSRSITCRYVRREIRSLTHDDRERFFDAAKALVDMETDPTISARTNWTKPMSYYIRTHLRNAIPNKRADRMHDGMGFIAQHTAITSDFEQALQAMDPLVSVPFWDYTIDAARFNVSGFDQTAFWDSRLWSPSWFGNATGSLHVVQEGRWAYTEVPKDDDPSPLTANAYGLLRAPWNLNPSSYVTRFHQVCGIQTDSTWPDCAAHHEAVFKTEDYATFIPYMAYNGHAGVHLMIGGAGGCEHWYDKFHESIGESNVQQMAFQAPFILRNAWRFGMCETPDYCSSDTDASECKMICRGCDNEVFSQEQFATYMSWFPFIKDGAQWYRNVSQNPNQIEAEMIRTVYCDSEQYFVGDQIEGNSPVDIPFWTIHGTMERLLVYKNLKVPFGNTSWWSEDFGWDGICKWGGMFAPDHGDQDQHNDYCAGHYEDDLSAFEVLASGDAMTAPLGSSLSEGVLQTVRKQMSNSEIMKLAMPQYTQYLPYVYEDFSWEHCEDLGFSFSPVDDDASARF